jgi:selenocysteine lyase/cysteine desulfurase
MLEGLAAIDGVTLYGDARERTPTVMFTLAGHEPEAVAAALARDRVAVWHGNFYAFELLTHLGLEPAGAVRAGALAYNDAEDVRRLVDGVARLAA